MDRYLNTYIKIIILSPINLILTWIGLAGSVPRDLALIGRINFDLALIGQISLDFALMSQISPNLAL